MIPSGIDLDNPLWDYALQVYPKLSEPLLALQGEGARVNQLLAALWCSKTARQWPGVVDQSIEQWHAEEVLPVRRRRMALKPQLTLHPKLEGLYAAYKQVELNSERIELAMLYRWLEPVPVGTPIPAAHNVDSVLRLNGVDLGCAARNNLIQAIDSL